MQHADFLVEIQTEELPPKTLLKLAENFLQELTARLQKSGLSFGKTQFFATPRRLAISIKKCAAFQPDTVVERKGPALKAAFDEAGQPTPACMGFARSLGVLPAELITITQPQGQWVGFNQAVPGKTAHILLPELIREALNALPITKRMRWGNHDESFVRPVHSVMLLYGKEIIKTKLFDCISDRFTVGHRFLTHKPISIASPAVYEKKLEKNFVIADFFKRRTRIQEKILEASETVNGQVLIHPDLLDEVTGLVEWPVALIGRFDTPFLEVPQEILISAMQDHQRYFPLINPRGQLLPYFVMISNIISRDPEGVVIGNERVLRARLSDAKFFFTTDKKIKLNTRYEKLNHIIFQEKLGTLADKTQRLMQLAIWIAQKLKLNTTLAERAAYLSKCDLTTEVVGEFPELQGIMGGYYAKQNGEKDEVARAIAEHYLPKFSGDALPKSKLGCVLALSDRIDSLVGIFGINEAPTGDRDPYALRRAATGILRILIEQKIELDLNEFIHCALHQYQQKCPNPHTARQTLNFILDRLKPWYQEQNIPADVLAAVLSLNITCPYDLHQRITAVLAFTKLAEANSLSIANKRVSNILARANFIENKNAIDATLFQQDAEKKLAKCLAKKAEIITKLSATKKYTEILTELAGLRAPIDDFFAEVMVMVDDRALRQNRLQLLYEIRALFLHVADITFLQ